MEKDMNQKPKTEWYNTATCALICATIFMNHAIAQQFTTTNDDEIEILTRGPVHEAFAETIVFDPEPGLIIPKHPPATIEELPPDHQPDGDNISWIPGYWSWDDERDDFIWVSGIWRALPPDRQWIPGYWAIAGQGAQWTSGYWADANIEEIEYLPEPPATVEAGPSSPAPSANDHWLPGSWVWQSNRYAWRPGYWAPGQDNWNWIPARYVWTSRGYVFVDGYYDYNVDRRGVLYAPVYFRSNSYTQRSFRYSPVTVINPNVFVNHLFLRPNYGHYYFGDYYGANYQTQGFSPWFSFHNNHSGYDPFYAQQQWQHRADQQWNQRMEADYVRRSDNELNRPPRNLRSQRERLSQGEILSEESFRVGTTLEELIKAKTLPNLSLPLAPDARQQLGKRGQEIRELNEQRRKLESDTSGRVLGPPDSSAAPMRTKIPRSTIVGEPIKKLEAGKAPPKSFAVPLSDTKVQPKPRPPRVENRIPPIRAKKNDGEKGGKGDKGSKGEGRGKVARKKTMEDVVGVARMMFREVDIRHEKILNDLTAVRGHSLGDRPLSRLVLVLQSRWRSGEQNKLKLGDRPRQNARRRRSVVFQSQRANGQLYR